MSASVTGRSIDVKLPFREAGSGFAWPRSVAVSSSTSRSRLESAAAGPRPIRAPSNPDTAWTEEGEWVNYTVNVARPGAYRIKALYAFQTNTVTFDLNGKPAATCRLPVLTANYHQWNFATIGTIQFPEAGPQLLTFRYGKGNNFAYFEFEPVASMKAAKP